MYILDPAWTCCRRTPSRPHREKQIPVTNKIAFHDPAGNWAPDRSSPIFEIFATSVPRPPLRPELLLAPPELLPVSEAPR